MDGGTQAIGPDEQVYLYQMVSLDFRLFKGGRLFGAVLNEDEVIWGEGIQHQFSAQLLATLAAFRCLVCACR